MRKLRPSVVRPSRVRLRHLAIAGGCLFAGLAGLRHMLDEPYPRAQVTLADEQRILDQFDLWSLHVCPRSIDDFSITRDPYGNPYRLICQPEGDRITLAIVSMGSMDLGAADAIVSSRTYSRD
jgi:hypothetical protein